MRSLTIIAVLLAGPAAAFEVTVPSGHELLLFDVIMEPPMGRFRFLLPAIADGVPFSDLVDDFDYLCAQVAQPALAQSDVGVTEVVISVSATEVPFGTATDVVQYFQPYRLKDGVCIWDAF
ncbi:MAG: hypothetical protein ACI93B_000123 [Yoonia sp.]